MECSQSLYVNLFSEDKVHVLKELLHACVDEICGRPGPTYHRFMNSMDWSKREYEDAYKMLSSLLRNPACLHISEEKMPAEYHELPDLVQHNLLTCLKVRREELTYALLNEQSKNERETLTDFDWRLRMVMGSSKLASLREPLLQLDLVMEHKDSRQVLGLEMNKEELDKMISSIETALQ